MNTMKGMHRPPFARMCLIARCVIQRRGFTHSSMAAELEVDRKTVQRDIDFMRDRLGYQIEFCHQRNGWFGQPPRQRIL
jgi:predicted DNA-binding transcriptional regulator YafY